MLQLEKDRGSSAAAREGGKCKKIKQGGGDKYPILGKSPEIGV